MRLHGIPPRDEGPYRRRPALLEERDIASIIVCGTLFEFGIRQTCAELADIGIGTLVVSDGVVALTHTAAAATSGDIAHGLTKLRTGAELLDLLGLPA